MRIFIDTTKTVVLMSSGQRLTPMEIRVEHLPPFQHRGHGQIPIKRSLLTVVEMEFAEHDPACQLLEVAMRDASLGPMFSVTTTNTEPCGRTARTKTGAWLVKGGGPRKRYSTKALANKAKDRRGVTTYVNKLESLVLEGIDRSYSGCGPGIVTAKLIGPAQIVKTDNRSKGLADIIDVRIMVQPVRAGGRR